MSNFFSNIPEITGKLEIYSQNTNKTGQEITIIGNPEGLSSLSKLIQYLADWDQELSDMPAGEREHLHLSPGNNLGQYSCSVEICRADAKGTGKFPSFMA